MGNLVQQSLDALFARRNFSSCFLWENQFLKSTARPHGKLTYLGPVLIHNAVQVTRDRRRRAINLIGSRLGLRTRADIPYAPSARRCYVGILWGTSLHVGSNLRTRTRSDVACSPSSSRYWFRIRANAIVRVWRFDGRRPHRRYVRNSSSARGMSVDRRHQINQGTKNARNERTCTAPSRCSLLSSNASSAPGAVRTVPLPRGTECSLVSATPDPGSREVEEGRIFPKPPLPN
jgi:hypothetical protein